MAKYPSDAKKYLEKILPSFVELDIRGGDVLFMSIGGSPTGLGYAIRAHPVGSIFGGVELPSGKWASPDDLHDIAAKLMNQLSYHFDYLEI